ncbi:hypothetical protein SAMN05216474_0851 [Lishizhenia tianjinensis]|uniref:10-bladed beta-propeller domain-containing protein n=1 Tax=Lishizhenia tianjinensis TaxID=477690 RepID=A0A1I6YFH0_9FLAO|nr:hypothetical protein [Lishizhenia tianjinensis]SFT48964.1 hypothetical protein SAMN05216474_0851 [Lishizhenia tianjinensis]
MRLLLLFTFLLSFNALNAQGLFPFLDNIGYLRSFENGYSKQLDYLPPTEYKYNQNLIVFRDHKRDLFVYDGKKKHFLNNTAVRYELGLNSVTWNIGPILFHWENGRRKTLSNFADYYAVSDSLVVFIDSRDNSIKAHYKDSIYLVTYSLEELTLPQNIGPTTFGFKGPGEVQYIFDRGKITEIGSSQFSFSYASGYGFSVFNDPINQSFALYENGEIFNIEAVQIPSYKAGNNFAVYLDQNRNLMYYEDGDLKKISNYSPDFYEVKDSIVVWGETNLFFMYDGEQVTQICNYIPEEYKLSNKTVAFRNVMGGVSVCNYGTTKEVTKVFKAEFDVNANIVRVETSKGNFLFYQNGKSYDY